MSVSVSVCVCVCVSVCVCVCVCVCACACACVCSYVCMNYMSNESEHLSMDPSASQKLSRASDDSSQNLSKKS